MEVLYQYVWKNKLCGRSLKTVDGRTVEVVYPGLHNTNSGPDFTGAKLKIEGQLWCGNVEIHIRASDWFAHGHDKDRAYDNVILHVVVVNDRQVEIPGRGRIPQTVIAVPENFFRLFAMLAEKISEVKCQNLLKELTPLQVTSWTETLAVERLQQKSQRIIDSVNASNGDWQRATFIALARGLGFGTNADPMEITARSIELKILSHHSDNAMQLEALLLGQAGLLDMSQHIFDEYYQILCREYMFLARKYGLKPMRREIWKTKLRPSNAPSRRVAMLAVATRGGFSMLDRIVALRNYYDKIIGLFDWELGEYWKHNRDFDQPGDRLSSQLSDASRALLVINFAAPLLYAYGASHGDADLAEKGLDLWYEAESENNSIITQWRRAGLTVSNAADSQALLQLRKEYCNRDRCLECRFGHSLLRKRCHVEQVS